MSCIAPTRAAARARSRSWNARWFWRPVSESVCAWCSRRRADVRVVDRERRGVGEADDELELLLGELLEPGAVDVERPLQPTARDERHHDQRLGIGRRVGDEPDARIELGPVREHRLAVLDRPAGDPHAERERLVREHLLGVDSARVHGAERLVDLVGLVEVMSSYGIRSLTVRATRRAARRGSAPRAPRGRRPRDAGTTRPAGRRVAARPTSSALTRDQGDVTSRVTGWWNHDALTARHRRRSACMLEGVAIRSRTWRSGSSTQVRDRGSAGVPATGSSICRRPGSVTPSRRRRSTGCSRSDARDGRRPWGACVDLETAGSAPSHALDDVGPGSRSRSPTTSTSTRRSSTRPTSAVCSGRESEPLLPNWRHLPVGYHGRAGTVVVSGTRCRSPVRAVAAPGADAPLYGPSRRLDIELELGFVVGVPSRHGEPVPVAAFEDHVFGVVLVNDWSARDIQAWEYQPLGPFLGKSFATSVSAWVTPLAVLGSARAAAPPQEPPPPSLPRRWPRLGARRRLSRSS